MSSLKFQLSREAALAVNLIMSSEFQSSGGCAGCRLNQEFEFLFVWLGCASSRLVQELSSDFQSSGRRAGSQLDQALEILIVRGGCANSQLAQELDFRVTLALRWQLS